MKYDALPTVFSIFSKKWTDFNFKKSKKSWIKETNDRILLLVQIQSSRWGAMYYLNFGVYFLDIEPIEKPLSDVPKPSDWHLFARYERFEELSTAEHNDLFSLEERNSNTLAARCNKIANFSEENILSKLKILGNTDSMYNISSSKDFNLDFFPFNTQKIAKKEILNYIIKQVNLKSP